MARWVICFVSAGKSGAERKRGEAKGKRRRVRVGEEWGRDDEALLFHFRQAQHGDQIFTRPTRAPIGTGAPA